jgi:hypothetical protein
MQSSPDHTSSNKRLTKLILFGILIALLLTGVGLGVFYSTQHNRQAQQKTSSSAKSQSSSTTPTPTTNPPPSAKKNKCSSQNLSLSLGKIVGSTAKPQYYRYLALTNTSSTTCTIGGYPGVSLLNQQGTQLGEPAVQTESWHSPVQTLKVAPGQPVYALITFLNGEAGGCLGPAANLRVYPPGETQALTVADSEDYSCSGPGFRVNAMTTTQTITD